MSSRVAVGGALAGGGVTAGVGVAGTERIERAKDRLRGVVRRTPLVRSAWLSARAGVPVYLKLECWQVTGSFKARGACHAVLDLDRGALARGLVTASAGNHGQAVALAAGLRRIPARVYVPAGAPAGKRTRIERLGAELVVVSGSYDDAAAAARADAAATGARFIHAFDDPDVVAGQGTVGLEIVEDLPDVACVVVPVGGGGLVAGVGAAVKGLRGPSSWVLGVQSEETVAMYAAFVAGEVVPTPVRPTLCDGLAGEVEAASFERAWSLVDALHLVEEVEVAKAIRALYEHEGVVAEGSGAVGVAAVLAGLELEGPTAIVVSGGNIDGKDLARILAGD